ncbi:MAG: TlyA family RNA methyltransferase [Pseudomonadota bacterium]
MPSKQHCRADELMVLQGLASSRSKAGALIMSGKCFIGTRRIDKAGQFIQRDSVLSVKHPDYPWVSRGGVKLAKAFEVWSLDVYDKICIDLGASTGGFSDVLLTRGAMHVHAIDVGRGQLHEKLRQSKKITNHERVNARYLTFDQIGQYVDVLVCDVSFIGLEKLLPAPMALVKHGGWLVALIKPQFQLERGLIGKGGIVRDHNLHVKACDFVKVSIMQQADWSVIDIIPSPIKGSNGNSEFLIYGVKSKS